MGNIKRKNENENVMPSMIQNKKKTTSVMPKLMIEDTFFEKRKRYLGTFIFVKMEELASKEPIPPLVESEKYEKMIFPQKRYIV